MWLLVLMFMLLRIIALSISTPDIHYVRTTDSPPSSCPGQPCLTLHQYAQINNFTTGTTLLLLPGNHSLQQTLLRLTSVSNITLRGEKSDSAVNIICTNAVAIQCENVTGFTVEGLIFSLNHAGPDNVGEQVAAIKLINCDEVLISNTKFKGSSDATFTTGRALLLEHSKVTISRCYFGENSAREGGAILSIQKTNLKICGSTFRGNKATDGGGGAVHAYYSTLMLDGIIPNHFTLNSATLEGGAIDCNHCLLEMRGYNTFENNSCPKRNPICDGGALAVNVGIEFLIMSGTVHFSYNVAIRGGAISAILTEANLTGNITLFQNTANEGGGIYIVWQSAIISTNSLSFIGNRAYSEGGALYISDSNLTFSGTTRIISNTATIGGGMRTQNSLTLFKDSTFFTGNGASNGGALNCLHGRVSFHGPTFFMRNMADKDGGALYAVGTAMHILDRVSFTLNTARNGGAMYLETGASVHLLTHACNYALLSTTSNSARQYGGGIYYADSATTNQCHYSSTNWTLHIHESKFSELPYCFLLTSLDPFDTRLRLDGCSIIYSNNDSAVMEGSFLYGGLLDRCRIISKYPDAITGTMLYIKHGLASVHSQGKAVSSKPYGLCICDDQTNSSARDCTKTVVVWVYRGQRFTVPLLATTQVGNTSTRVLALTSPKAVLDIYQTSQPLPDYCHPLQYTLYSTDKHELVVLYPDGPCRDTGTARVVINVILLPCPDGFTQSGELCICEERLRHYDVSCTIDDTPYLTKMANSKFWMGVLYTNTTSQGLVLGKSCPVEYCKTSTVRITLDNPDIQCDLNRSGLLCGACATNHSLMLGSSKCEICSNTCLSLLLPFAAAGVVLVVFLTLLRLTVATGTLNSVILYANIVQINRKLFLPANTKNVLTVFLAWTNLDLGFQTCFHDGLDAYVLTWLQFIFPVYIWLLMGLIIFISRYSITVSKFIGSNPIAVLATLLLMSYTKILKIIVDVYSSVKLDYPDNKTDTVWLKDANVPYLHSRHLLLTVVTSLVLTFLFFPYTFLLLLGHKLYRFTGRKYFCWLNRIKPLLDSYYAPYKVRTRYWTGLLLLVRCVLYIIFSLGATSQSLLAIIITFTALVILAWLTVRIYKEFYVNIMEASVYLNLIVLSAATATNSNTPALVYTMVGIVFATMIGVIVYQICLLYVAKSAVWLRVKAKIASVMKSKADKRMAVSPADTSSHDPHTIVTKTVVELREPLLEPQN